MSPEPEIDAVEKQLRALPYVDDDGFTDRVMARIPARRRHRRGVVLGASAVAVGIAAWSMPALVEGALAAAAEVTAVPASAVVAVGASLVVLAAAAVGRLLWE